MINRSVNTIKNKNTTKLAYDFLMESMDKNKQNQHLANLRISSDFEKTNKRNQPPRLFFEEPATCPLDFADFVSKVQQYIACNKKQSEDQRKSIIWPDCNIVEQQLKKFISAFKKQQAVTCASTTNAFLRKSFNVRQSKQGAGSQLKRIKELEQDNERLNAIVNRHEDTNIKLFIKVNEGECNSLENYKNKLEQSFNILKSMESKLTQYSNRIKLLQQEKQAMETVRQSLEKSNRDKSKLIDDLRSQSDTNQSSCKQCSKLPDVKQLLDQQNKELEDVYLKLQVSIRANEDKDMVLQRLSKKKNEESRIDCEYMMLLMMQAKTIEQFRKSV